MVNSHRPKVSLSSTWFLSTYLNFFIQFSQKGGTQKRVDRHYINFLRSNLFLSDYYISFVHVIKETSLG